MPQIGVDEALDLIELAAGDQTGFEQRSGQHGVVPDDFLFGHCGVCRHDGSEAGREIGLDEGNDLLGFAVPSDLGMGRLQLLLRPRGTRFGRVLLLVEFDGAGAERLVAHEAVYLLVDVSELAFQLGLMLLGLSHVFLGAKYLLLAVLVVVAHLGHLDEFVERHIVVLLVVGLEGEAQFERRFDFAFSIAHRELGQRGGFWRFGCLRRFDCRRCGDNGFRSGSEFNSGFSGDCGFSGCGGLCFLRWIHRALAPGLRGLGTAKDCGQVFVGLVQVVGGALNDRRSRCWGCSGCGHNSVPSGGVCWVGLLPI